MRPLSNRVFSSIAILTLVVFSSAHVPGDCIDARAVNPADFVSGIDNPYLPLVPGTTFIYEAETPDGLEVEFYTVTTQTKVIAQVTCTVIHDVVLFYPAGTSLELLSEDTFDWHAQDKEGNVWYFGEDSKAFTYDDAGNLVDVSTEGSWEAGVDGALPGIVMPADPQPGVCNAQEFLEGVAEDYGKVLRLNAKASIEAFGDFEDCLETKEWSPLEHGAVEHKYYSPGLGLVLGVEFQGGTVRTELVDVLTE